MSNCAVATCKNYSKITKESGIKYFRFPRNDDLAKKWTVLCRRGDKINIKNARICSAHFADSCFDIPLIQKLLEYNPKNSRNLKPDAVPTLNLPRAHLKRKNEERELRLAKRTRRNQVDDILKASNVLQLNTLNTEVVSEKPTVSELVYVDNVPLNIDHQLSSQLKVETIEKEVRELRDKIKTLEEQNSELQKKVEEVRDSTIKKYEDILASVFTPGQIRKLISGNKKRIIWSAEDISSAISLRSVSPKAYRFLIANNYPLPALSTLRKWVSNIDVN